MQNSKKKEREREREREREICIVRGLSEEFSTSTIDGYNMGKIFFIHLS